MDTDVRAKEGLFLGMQYPVEVPGVSNFKFLHTAFNSIMKHQGAGQLEDDEFRLLLNKKMNTISMNENFLDRGVNQGFSGGEKKKNEILQMAVLSPKLAFLDETDSGLDVDALRAVADGVNKLRTSDNAIVLITHYQRLLDYIRPDFVHIFMDGKIVVSGDFSLAEKIETQGYDWLVK
jgi:Fe-S cluster assembly ATP-binding protein